MLNGFKKRFDCSLKYYDDCVFVYQSLHEGCDYGDMNAPVKVTTMTCDEGFDYGEIKGRVSQKKCSKVDPKMR